MSAPSLNEWKRSNPGKGVNEYYKAYPNSKAATPIATNHFQPPILTSAVKEEISIGNIIFSVMIIVGFMLPWIDIKPFRLIQLIESNGYHLPRIIEKFTTVSSKMLLNSIYLIPVGALVCIFAETTRNFTLKLFSQIIVVFALIYWVVLLYQLIASFENQFHISIEYVKILSYGFYLTCFATCYYIYDLFFGDK